MRTLSKQYTNLISVVFVFYIIEYYLNINVNLFKKINNIWHYKDRIAESQRLSFDSISFVKYRFN